MELNPYLNFNGQCDAAFRFYEKVLGGKILMRMTYGESPMAGQTAPEHKDRIMHVRLAVGDKLLMGADAPPQFYEPTKGMAVTLGINTPAEAERVFQALSENGAVRMPMQETFWAHRFGMLVDQFGVPWLVNCEKPTQ